MSRKYRIPPSMIGGNHFYADDQGVISDDNDREKPQHFYEADRNHKGGSMYNFIRYGKYAKKAHKLICAARWGIPRKGLECHHLNGNKFDNRPMNLIWLSKPRHQHYENRLKALRMVLGDLSIYSRKDFVRWARMSEHNFQAMLANYTKRDPKDIMDHDLTHHCEI